MNYPENLLQAIMGGNMPVITDQNRNDIYATLQYVQMKCCTERDRKILLLRFKEEHTLQQIADTTNVTKERVRQIINHSLRKMRTGTFFEMLSVGLMVWHKEELAEHRRLMDARINEVSAMYEDKMAEMQGVKTAISEGKTITLEDMELSVRSYNCLWRAGLRTVTDIALLTMKELAHIRNFGCKSYNEVLEKLHSYGMRLSDEPKGVLYESTGN